MRRHFQLLIAIAASAFVYCGAAQAQASRTWVSGVGDDVNPCSRTAPCKTFAGAISKTAAGGEINCLDSAGFGSVTITKSLTIKCEGTIGGITASTFGVNVNDSGSGTPGQAIVTLSGLNIEGDSATTTNGIQFTSGAALHVHKTQIRNFRAAGSGNGISFTPATASKLFVADSYITDNGIAATAAGILVRPTGTGSARVSVNRVQLENNSNGVRVDTSVTNQFTVGAIRDGVVSGSPNNGISVSAGAFINLTVEKMGLENNGTGLASSGAAAQLLVRDSTMTSNNTGLSASGGAKIFTYGNNGVNANNVDGAFTNSIGEQ